MPSMIRNILVSFLVIALFFGLGVWTTAQKKGGFTVDASCGVNSTEEMQLDISYITKDGSNWYKADAHLGKCSAFYRGNVTTGGDVIGKIEDDIISQQAAVNQTLKVATENGNGNKKGKATIKQ